MSLDRLEECQRTLGYAFKKIAYLKVALTHSSIKTETVPSNERMEFLGDSVLGAIISQHLFQQYPDYDEGELSRIKSVVVSAPVLARESQRLRLTRYLFVGKGMSKQEKLPHSLLANAFEAIVAAIFLDRGMAATRKFVLGRLTSHIEAVVRNQHRRNFKSILQHHCQ
ncbi:MAG: ribonuclease III, partial [Planctomycetota bacterium]|nr:ribonuclease III [Planctomycetota bacterium]